MQVPRLRFTDKVIIITGGTSGIGLATAEQIAAEGGRVVLTGRRAELGHSAAARLGGLFVECDHRIAADCQRVVDTTLAAFGRVDGLFNNAGIVVAGTAETTSEADWADCIALNVTAPWRMAKLVLPVMRARGGGAILNNASDWGLVGAPAALAYCASKGALVQMTRAMAIDAAPDRIRVNAICPGDTFVDRWRTDGYARGTGSVHVSADAVRSDIPLGRVAQPGEIASAALFLLSDEASYCTGTLLAVDGGNTAQ